MAAIRPQFLALLCALFLTGCPRQALFVVLPNAEGSGVGAITVDDGKKAVTLDHPYKSAELRDDRSAPADVSKSDIFSMFRRAFEARPVLPHRFRLAFKLDSTRLTAASAPVYRALLADIKQHAAYRVDVVGYADTLGSSDYNANLSLLRAVAIRNALVRDGVDPRAVRVTFRGKRDLLVATPDQSPEPRNRRVDVSVR
ncbi:MAG TPA: OmpA family protein [Stellaceae bacterium]|nr:OmpA family protein [Stellaceae bacterium]